MSGDDEELAFRLDLNVPSEGLDPDDQRRAMAWLEQLARQLSEADGGELTLSMKVTGLYDDEYPDGREEPSDSPPGGASPCSGKKAVVNIMVCPGRRPYT
jgi:hypothetical protein